MSTNSNSESYVASLISISGTPAVGDFEQENHSDLCLSGWSMAARGGLAAKEVAPAIRTVIAGPTIFDGRDIRAFLKHEPGVVIVDECRETDLEAVIRREIPDLVVLDIGGEDLTRSRWSSKVNECHGPAVLCVSSNAEHATRAFSVRALDFLVRPFDQGRFRGAMGRVRQELGTRQRSLLAQQLIDLWKQPQSREQTDQLVFRVDGRLIFMDLSDIDWIGASANYVRLNAGAESYLVRESIGRLSQRLDPDRFIRIHRSVIVNVRRIKELQSCNAGEYLAVLKNGKKLPCSRGFRGELERHISRCLQVANTGR